jgi:2-dehydropantoate 2-reductase
VRFVVLGAGGIGLVLASHLARAGHDVTLVARGEQLDAVRQWGIEVRGLREFVVDVDAAPSATGPCDLLVVATKTPDTVAALACVRDLDVHAALSVQNGVVKDRLLAEELGGDKVLGATTMLGGERIAPGVVNFTLDGMTAIGELGSDGSVGGPVSQRIREIAAAWNDAELAIETVEDVKAHEWAKQILQAAVSPLSVLAELPIHLLWSLRPFAESQVALMREAGAVAAALGVAPSPYEGYGFDVPAILNDPWEDAVRRIQDRGEALIAAGNTAIVVSMLQDIRSGRRTEIEETAGYVVAEGRRLGVPVPVLAFACDVVRGKAVAADSSSD